jgi:hypothetical protein
VISSSLHGSEIQASEYHPVKYGLARWNGGMAVVEVAWGMMGEGGGFWRTHPTTSYGLYEFPNALLFV